MARKIIPLLDLARITRLLLAGVAFFGVLNAASAVELSFPDAHLAVTVPDSWQRSSKIEPGTLIDAESKAEGLRMQFAKAPFSATGKVSEANVQADVKTAWKAQGFSKNIRDGLITVAGQEAYFFESAMENQPYSILQIIWLQESSYYSLVFFSTAKPLQMIGVVQEITNSVRTLPRTH